MKNCEIFKSVAFIAGCLVLGLCLVWAVKANKSFDRTVSVRGLCEKEVKADKVIWPLTFKMGGNVLADLYSQTNQMNEKIIAFLKDAGIKEEEISVGTPDIDDNLATTYRNEARYNYLITSVVTVCSENVDLVLEVQGRTGDLISMGVPVGTGNSWESRTVFSFNGLNDIKPAMIEEATENARAAAEKFAADSKSRLGKIKTASQGQFTITDRDSNTPYIKNVRVVTSVVYYLSD